MGSDGKVEKMGVGMSTRMRTCIAMLLPVAAAYCLRASYGMCSSFLHTSVDCTCILCPCVRFLSMACTLSSVNLHPTCIVVLFAFMHCLAATLIV